MEIRIGDILWFVFNIVVIMALILLVHKFFKKQ
jgi:hypothetical protein